MGRNLCCPIHTIYHQQCTTQQRQRVWSVRVVEYCGKLTEEIVNASAVEMFRA